MNDKTKDESLEEKEEAQEEPPEEQPQPKVFISTSTKRQAEKRRAKIQTRDLSPEQIEKNLKG